MVDRHSWRRASACDHYASWVQQQPGSRARAALLPVLRRISFALANAAAMRDEANCREMGDALRAFIRLYRPHAARKDTVLFRAFQPLVGPREYDALGEQFEDREHALFGKAGFEGTVAEVAKIEQALGLYDLSQFTPPTR